MKKILSTAIAATIAGGAIADQTTVSNKKAEEVIVTATRTEQTYAETLASVTVFTREDIAKLQAQSLAELLSRAPGMSATINGGRGANAGISLRGNQTDHSLFLVDGVRVGSSTLGSTSVQYIDPELIERVEIVRGPKSSLYGSDALGGVINIITRKADANKPLLIKAGIGNYETSNMAVSFGHKAENYHFNLTASHQYTGGYDFTSNEVAPNDDDDAFRQDSLGFNGGVEVNKDLSLTLSYQLNESESEYDANCGDALTYMPVACSPYTDSKTQALNLGGQWQVLEAWTTALNVGSSEDESEILADDIDISTTYNGGEYITEKTDIAWQNDIRLHETALLTLGYDYLKEEVDGTTAYDENERDNKAGFVQLQYMQGAVSANLGARNDDNEQFGSHDTYNASVGYDINADLKIVASYGEAFKAPTFNDLYFPFFGNPNMIPEESDTYEIAMKGFGNDYSWTISAYQNDIENLIQYNALIFANDQIAKARTKGLEATFEKNVYGWLVNTSLTLLDTEDKATGNELARRPEQVLNIDIDRSFNQWSVGASLYAVNSRYDDAANTSELNGYGTVALRSAYAVNDEWKLQLKVDNLFDKDYVTTSSFNLGDYVSPGTEVLFSVVYTPEI